MAATAFALRYADGRAAPYDPSVAAIEGARTLLQQASELETAVYGTTLVANTLIARSGAKVALLVTRGFRDVLEIRNEQPYDIHDLFLQYPEPLAPRSPKKSIQSGQCPSGLA